MCLSKLAPSSNLIDEIVLNGTNPGLKRKEHYITKRKRGGQRGERMKREKEVSRRYADRQTNRERGGKGGVETKATELSKYKNLLFLKRWRFIHACTHGT